MTRATSAEVTGDRKFDDIIFTLDIMGHLNYCMPVNGVRNDRASSEYDSPTDKTIKVHRGDAKPTFDVPSI